MRRLLRKSESCFRSCESLVNADAELVRPLPAALDRPRSTTANARRASSYAPSSRGCSGGSCNGGASLADLRSAGSDRTRVAGLSGAAGSPSTIGGNGGPAPHVLKERWAEEAGERLLRFRAALVGGARGLNLLRHRPATVLRACKRVKTPSRDPYRELTGMGTCVRDGSRLGVHALPSSPRPWERHGGAFGRVGAPVHRPGGGARTYPPPRGSRAGESTSGRQPAGTVASRRRSHTSICARAWRCSPSLPRSRRTASPLAPSPSSLAGDDPANESPRLLSAGHGRRRSSVRRRSRTATKPLGAERSVRNVPESRSVLLSALASTRHDIECTPDDPRRRVR